MAERRMFSKVITDTDAFLEMPLSTQALYFHLAMHADDEGFVSSPKRILRETKASEDDFKLLIVKRFILTLWSNTRLQSVRSGSVVCKPRQCKKPYSSKRICGRFYCR